MATAIEEVTDSDSLEDALDAASDMTFEIAEAHEAGEHDTALNVLEALEATLRAVRTFLGGFSG